jgi:caa(3)-type oxidase subunit IV
MSHDNIKDHVKVYWNVFYALLVLTVLTVAVSYFEFGGITWLAVGVKGYLVASEFMHLNDNNPTINWTLILTVIFLLLLFAIPKLWENDLVTSDTTVLFDELGQDKVEYGDHH